MLSSCRSAHTCGNLGQSITAYFLAYVYPFMKGLNPCITHILINK